MCKVSVVTTCYNPGDGLKKTIESVLGQTYTDFEYIIQDGGSTDGALELARSYEASFAEKGIRYHVYSEKDSGIYDGMNRAVAKANGEYVNFMNADDVFFDKNVLNKIFGNEASPDVNCGNEEKRCISRVLDEKIKNADVIYGDCVELEFGDYYYFAKDFDKITRGMPFSHQSVFAKRELLTTFPFRTDLRIGSDYDFLLSAYDNEVEFADCGCVVCIITKDGVSSTDLYNTFVETVAIQKAHGIVRFGEEEYQKKLKSLKLRQFGMDYLPDFAKKAIRIVQRKMRGQSRKPDMSGEHY